MSVTENCVPACLSCNGRKSDQDVFEWYRLEHFYDPRRAMAIRAWIDGDLRLALRLLQWAQPDHNHPTRSEGRKNSHSHGDDEQNWGLRTA